MDADEADRYSAAEYRRLFDAARRSLEGTGGDLSRTVTVKTPDDKERRAIIGITGQYRPEGISVLAVRLADLDRVVRQVTGHGLRELLERLGPPLKDRPADRQRLSDGREAALRVVEKSELGPRMWFHSWLAELVADGTMTRLVNSVEAGQVRQAVRVLEWLEQRAEIGAAPAHLAELAAAITGDARALNHGSTLATLVLRALALRQGTERPVTIEQRRDLWDQSGVVVDDLASRVLVLNLPAAGTGLGEWLTAAASYGTPFYVTRQQLTAFPLTVSQQVVYACENPGLLRRAAAELGPASRPLICAEGQPSTAFHRLAAAVSRGGGELRYHGDFDWPGVAIAARIGNRDGARPWRMAVSDYAAALDGRADSALLAGAPQQTPWDPELAAAMTAAGRAVYEESVAADLIADLGRD